MKSVNPGMKTPWKQLTETTYTRQRRGLTGMTTQTGTIFDILKEAK
jgi:hypothetical protein